MSVDHKSPYYNEGRKAGAFYAESWGLVHYLMLAEGGKHRPQLQQYINSLTDDLPPEEAFKRAFQTDLKSVEDQLRSYLSGRLFPILNVTFTERLSVEKEIQIAILPEAQVQYYLGDLFLQMSRPEEAETRLQKSLNLDPTLASSQISLGILKAAQEKPDEARKLFQSAIEHDPKNYLAHYYFARSLLRAKQYDEAIKSYQESIQLKSNISLTYSGLGYAYLEAGRPDDAMRAFNEGLKINPRDEYFYRAIAYLLLEKRQGQAAVNYADAYLVLKGWRADHSPYMALVKYFGLRQAQRVTDAQKALDEAETKVNTTEWPYPVFRYLKHTLTLAELLAQAGNDQDHLTEAHAYAGLQLSLDGQRELALEHLHWVKEKGNKKFVEYPLALAEIARLEGGPAPTP